MMSLYTGTPGSGKSFHMAHRIYNALRNHDVNIIGNFPLNLDNVALTRLGWLKTQLTERTKGKIAFKHYNSVKLKGRYFYWDNSEVTVDNLKQFARLHHTRKFGRKTDEPQTIVFLDEAGIIFNSRAYADKGRNEWTTFFCDASSLHV